MGFRDLYQMEKPKEDNTSKFAFKLLGDKSGYEVSAINNKIVGEIHIPSTYENLPVTKIKKRGFSECSKITKLFIPSTINEIGEKAFFSCFHLNELIFDNPKKNLIIGQLAFGNCYLLKTLNLPNGVIEIKENAFLSCNSLENIILPKTLKKISLGAFDCASKNINIFFEGTIEDWCGLFVKKTRLYRSDIHFYVRDENQKWNELTQIVLPSNINIIYDYTFYRFVNLAKIKLNDEIEKIGESSFENCTSLKEIELPTFLKIIETKAFYNCSNLSKVNLRENIKKICDLAFAKCSSLKTINNLSNLKLTPFCKEFGMIAANANHIFSSLQTKQLENNNGLCVYNEEKEKFLRGYRGSSSRVVIADVTIIDNEAFANCKKINKVIITNGVKEIRKQAFLNCINLEELELPASLKKIQESAFYNCSKLKKVFYNGTLKDWCAIDFSLYSNPASFAEEFYVLDEYNKWCKVEKIKIPEGVKTLKPYTFNGFKFLKEVNIPVSLKIVKASFCGCELLDNIYYNGTILDWCKIDFDSSFSNPLNFCKHFFMHDGKGNFEEVKYLKVPGEINTIKQYQFGGLKNLKTVELEEGIEIIEDNAFNNCISLRTITLPSSLKKIGYNVFYNCKKIIEIDNKSTANIDYGTIAGFHNIEKGNISNIDGFILLNQKRECVLIDYDGDEKDLVVPAMVSKIGKNAFYCNTNIRSVDIGDSVSVVDEYAFCGCKNLKKIILGKSLKRVRKRAFSELDSLSRIIAHETKIEIDYEAFDKKYVNPIEIIIDDRRTITNNKIRDAFISRKYVEKNINIFDSIIKVEELPSFGEIYENLLFDDWKELQFVFFDGYYQIWCGQISSARNFIDFLLKLCKSKYTTIPYDEREKVEKELQSGLIKFKQLSFTPNISEPPTIIITNLSQLRKDELKEIKLSEYKNGYSYFFIENDIQFLLDVSWY